MKVLIIGDSFTDTFKYCKRIKENPEHPGSFVYGIIDERVCVGGASNTSHALHYLNPDITIQNEHNETQPNKIRFETDDITFRIDEVFDLKLTQIKFDANYDAIIISDYAKGCITEELISKLKLKFQDTPIFVDTKPSHYKWYKDVFCITPNFKELTEIYPDELDIVKAANRLSKELNTNVVVTMGENGCLFTNENRQTSIPFDGIAVDNINVSGAGDVFMASLCSTFLNSKSLKMASEQANKSAAKSVENMYTGLQ